MVAIRVSGDKYEWWIKWAPEGDIKLPKKKKTDFDHQENNGAVPLKLLVLPNEKILAMSF